MGGVGIFGDRILIVFQIPLHPFGIEIRFRRLCRHLTLNLLPSRQ